MSDQDERPLLERARAGDPDSLEALLETYAPRIYRFALKMCRQTEDAQDVVQETLLAAAGNLNEFRGDSSIGTWLFTVARNFCLKMRRPGRSVAAVAERARPRDPSVAGSVADRAPGPDAVVERRQDQAAIEAAIEDLEPKYREVLVLRDVEGLSSPEVARALGLRVSAVKSRLHRARKAVRDAMTGGLDEPVIAPAAICPDVVRLLSQYLEGDIGSKVCARMEAHVEQCDRCKEICDSLRRTLAYCRSVPEAELPPGLRDSIRRDLRALRATRHAAAT